MRLLLSTVLLLLMVLGLVALSHAAKNHMRSRNETKLKDKVVKLSLDPLAPLQVMSRLDQTIANMSLSPWTYRESCVKTRYPECISQAECLTSGCLGLQGEEDLSLEAKPIYFQMLVLHRVTNQKKRRIKYNFRLGTVKVAVACTCVRPTAMMLD